MATIKVAICPIDVVMFRDPLPFEIGGYARSYKIPLPSTFSGVIRSLLREEFPSEDDLYKDDKRLKWTLRGPFPSLIKDKEIEVFYPLPRDVSEGKGGGFLTLGPSSPYSYSVNGIELFSPPRLKDGEFLKRPRNGLMSGEAFIKYLKGETIGGSWLKEYDELFGIIERPGVALSDAKVVEFGMFYSVEALEAAWMLEGKSIVRGCYMARVSIDEDALEKLRGALKKGVVRFGGEARPSSIIVVKEGREEEWDRVMKDVAGHVSKNKKFKVYLATPTLFGNESTSKWIPSWLSEQNLKGRFLGNGPVVRLVGASIGKPIGVSGWDYAEGHVKPMYTGIPTGSIFYFEIEEDIGPQGVIEKVIRPLKDNNIGDIMTKLGFGTAFVGVW